jgi:cytoplasmic iron level regulating protein YaaA (DUF328/UPF0246 family)
MMITFLVSSKTMVKKEADFKLKPTTPLFLAEAEVLNEALEKLSLAELKKLMHISDNLAKETKLKIESWDGAEAWWAWLYFSGDVYKGLVAESLEKADFEWAQNRVWTLSGLYGAVRPLDLIKPYRLEAGFKLKTKLKSGEKKNLYEFWGDKIAREIKDEVVLNLSSEEYIKLIRGSFKGKIVTPLFLQNRKKGDKREVKFEAVHAKVARGMMARWIIQNRIESELKLKEFGEDGYVFDESRSSELEPVFVREAEGVMKIKK